MWLQHEPASGPGRPRQDAAPRAPVAVPATDAPPWTAAVGSGPPAWAELDAGLRLVRASTLCHDIWRHNAPVLWLDGDRVASSSHADRLARALADARLHGRAVLSLPRPDRLPLMLRLQPASRPPAAASTADAHWWLWLRDPDLEAPDGMLLRELFGLTPTEARVACLLARGDDSAGIAAALGVRTNTVQIHIKSLLAKTETRRQAQLVALLLRSVAMQVGGGTARPVTG